MNYHAPLHPDSYYHIYNRGNNGENIFYTRQNYFYFLRQYHDYLSPYLDTFAYCLLPNHFHLLVRVKPEKEFPGFSDAIAVEKNFPGFSDAIPSSENLPGFKNLEGLSATETVSNQFRKLFMRYAKGINKQQGRTGSLFQKNFKRKLVDNEHYYSQLIYYIHANPERHGITGNFKTYPYSSYASLLSDKPTKLFRHETLEWFGSKEAFRQFHAQQQNTKAINNWMIEDD